MKTKLTFKINLIHNKIYYWKIWLMKRIQLSLQIQIPKKKLLTKKRKINNYNKINLHNINHKRNKKAF